MLADVEDPKLAMMIGFPLLSALYTQWTPVFAIRVDKKHVELHN